jgi:phosphoesterase RecJ-like protein
MSLPNAKELFSQLDQHLQESKKVVIISHNRPDGDTTGSNLALKLHLETLGKEVTSACADPIPENFHFLPKVQDFTQEFLLEDFDTVIIVDAGARHLIRFFEIYPELTRTRKPIISIDHHFSNDNFGTLNIIDPKETSTTSLLYRYFTEQNHEITKDIATCLLNGIYTDTGSFMHSNTTPETMSIASELIKKGANFKAISKYNFKTKKTKNLKLIGEVLDNLSVNKENVVVGAVSQDLFERYNATSEDLSGVADMISSIPSTDYSMLLTESKDGKVKASLRTRKENVNVAKIAEQYGGGGHAKAAGFKTAGKLVKKTIWELEE